MVRQRGAATSAPALLAAIRGTVEPVAPASYARFLPAWQHIAGAAGGRPLEGVDGVLAVIEQLAGVPLPASAWESLILPLRVSDYTRRCSTSSPRPATSSGLATARCRAATVGSPSTRPTP
jgi:hypothetical protein